MTSVRTVLPFTSLVGQQPMKTALVLNAINPAIGGVLIRGERGTAKSTAVRALVRVLPEIDCVRGCRYRCDPDDPQRWCDDCRARAAAGETMPSERVPIRVVDLPINASEDRVVGTIDTEAAIKRGERVFEPGVLAAANRGILYVDEVNLLDDHLVDVLLDAAAMGENIVEREGISFAHPAGLILVGTMNPEEGELRPQLLDRFGLCVDIAGLRRLEDRVSVMERDLEGQESLVSVHEDFAGDEEHLRDVIVKARELLPLVDIPAQIRWFIALVCIDAGALGHRADIVVSNAARTLRAWREASLVVGAGRKGAHTENRDALLVTTEDVVAAAELALSHRRRPRVESGPPAQAASQSQQQHQERYEEMAREAESAVAEPLGEEHGESAVGDDASAEQTDSSGELRGQERANEAVTRSSGEQLFDGSLFPVRKIALPRDRRTRAASGKRSSAQSKNKRGRYVRSSQSEHVTDVAFDATVRAAAPHQRRRRAERSSDGGPALHLERQDLRQKVRRRRTGTLIVFVVDASASMDAEQRMQATKGAVLSLLRDAYVRRDKVALVVFSGRTARVVLQPTSSIDLAEHRLQRLTVGGTTPLTHGLVAGIKVVRNERIRDRSVYPLVVLISDGRGNISLFGEEPLVEAQRVAEQIAAEHVHVLVIDSARDHSARVSLPRVGMHHRTPLFGGYGFNACQDLAQRAHGEYLGLYDLSQGAIVEGVEKTLRGR
ncbi:MAG: magnesium chelatase subunit D family protein [Candidatus Dormibacteraeota bacterium]|nr:magnesium chelatase subunit D family protein [Candidatus Dormibacteraeota bacterium]